MGLFWGRFLCSRLSKQPHDAMVNGNFEVANSINGQLHEIRWPERIRPHSGAGLELGSTNCMGLDSLEDQTLPLRRGLGIREY